MGTVFNFARKALLQVLPTASNLVRWGRTQDPNCSLCKKQVPQTNKHVMSNYFAPPALSRYKERHDKVLTLIVSWLRSVASPDQKVYYDLDNNDLQVCDLFIGRRPDIAIVDSNSIKTWELTICHESNFVSSRQYKVNKYLDLNKYKSSICANKLLFNFTLEISTLGFISQTKEFLKCNNLPKLPVNVKKSIISSLLNSSLCIYYNRNTQ